jgi:hypothetical protein
MQHGIHNSGWRQWKIWPWVEGPLDAEYLDLNNQLMMASHAADAASRLA